MSNSAAFAKSPEQRDGHILHVGQQCSAPTCFLVDFLPLKCQHCSEAFCGEHFMPTAHKCLQYDASKYDRVAPSCPLCDTPVAIPPGEDPNLRMERHISTECSVVTGKTTKTPSVPVCARAKCGKKLFAPIKCDKCNQQFCAEHRYPSLHTCATSAAPTKPSSSTSSSSPASSLPSMSAKSAAALAVFKRSLTPGTASTSASTPAQSTARRQNSLLAAKPSPVAVPSATAASEASSSAKPFNNPFSKQDRRAKAERASRRTAMLERAKRGLLSQEEQAMLAAEEAEAKSEEKKGDCIAM